MDTLVWWSDIPMIANGCTLTDNTDVKGEEGDGESTSILLLLLLIVIVYLTWEIQTTFPFVFVLGPIMKGEGRLMFLVVRMDDG